MKQINKSLLIYIATIAFAWLTAAGCGTTTGGTVGQPGAASRGSTSQKPLPSTQAGFARYKWRVIAIDHDGKETPIPARYNVYLKFMSNGDFGGNDPVNYHSGTYRVVHGGFITGRLATSLVGYAGKDPIVLLTVSAISAFDPGVHAAALVTGNRLEVTVDSYLLDCQRDGA